MSDKQAILNALKAAGAPDYMVLIITEVVGTKDEIRAMMAELNTRSVDVRQREQVVAEREQVLKEQQQAFMDAAKDMKEFANRIYGPDSELTKINAKLGALEAAGHNRENRYAERFRVIDENQTRLKDSFESKINAVNERVDKLTERVDRLEKTG